MGGFDFVFFFRCRHELHELTRILRIIRVNLCNSWQKILAAKSLQKMLDLRQHLISPIRKIMDKMTNDYLDSVKKQFEYYKMHKK
jgi:F420-0:gamma-glutamyl ligase-like protein